MCQPTYTDAGVNLQAAQNIKERIKSMVTPTHGAEVLGGVGGFGALYRLGDYRQPVLVSSTDGVGTKLKLAVMMNRYDTIGEDLVNACLNDIIVCGAKPLFFLDYIAVGELDGDVVAALIAGMARACEQAGCALIGGETAQMPGLYSDGEFDMAGFVVGVVEQDAIIDGSRIRAGDSIIGVPSNGLHTNGYSLVRHALGLDDDPSPLREMASVLGDGITLGDALLMPHPSYDAVVRPVMPMLKGMAHITGGGIVENVPRILPQGLSAQFHESAWHIPPIFSLLQERCCISRQEMYRVFNMGIGMALICDPSNADAVLASLLSDAGIVGVVSDDRGDGRVNIV